MARRQLKSDLDLIESQVSAWDSELDQEANLIGRLRLICRMADLNNEAESIQYELRMSSAVSFA